MSATRRSAASTWHEGEAASKKMKTSKENDDAFCEGIYNNFKGFFFHVELRKPERLWSLIKDPDGIPGFERTTMLRTILWAHGIELNASRHRILFNNDFNERVIKSIAPKSPAAHDGRLKIDDLVVAINGVSGSPSLSSILSSDMANLKNLVLEENLKLKVFRSYTHAPYSSEEISASEPLLGAQFCARILRNPKFSDVVFEVGNERIPSYRVLVADKSSVFEAMLTHDMREKKTGVIKIKGFEPAVFRSLLNFIYTDKLEFKDNSVAHLMQLARAGDFYDVKGLKEKVLQRLPFLLTKETAVDILMLANQFHFDDFTNGILTFIAIWSSHIMSSESFSVLEEHPDLLVRLLRVKSEVSIEDQQFLFDLAKAKLVSSVSKPSGFPPSQEERVQARAGSFLSMWQPNWRLPSTPSSVDRFSTRSILDDSELRLSFSSDSEEEST